MSFFLSFCLSCLFFVSSVIIVPKTTSDQSWPKKKGIFNSSFKLLSVLLSFRFVFFTDLSRRKRLLPKQVYPSCVWVGGWVEREKTMVVQCWSCGPPIPIPNPSPNPGARFGESLVASFWVGVGCKYDNHGCKYWDRDWDWRSNRCKAMTTSFVDRRISSSFRRKRFTCLLQQGLGLQDLAEIAHNKVLVAAGVSAAVGQLSKPFTSVLLYGKDFDFRASFQAGGFPSTHSSAVVATAASLALERGFSDSVFGLAVVYAGLVMYDAQGVRREVGNHAKALNKLLPKTQVTTMVSVDRDDMANSRKETGSSSFNEDDVVAGSLPAKDGSPFVPNSNLLLESDNKTRQTMQVLGSPASAAVVEGNEKVPNTSGPLKESVGHNEFEVIAGALLGLFVSMALHTIV